MKFEMNIGSEQPKENKVESYSPETEEVFADVPEPMIQALDIRLNNEGSGLDSLKYQMDKEESDPEVVDKIKEIIRSLPHEEGDLEQKINEVVILYEEL